MEKYYKYIADQIKSATGIKTNNADSREIVAEHIDWLKERRKIGEEYTKFLDYLGLNYQDPSCAEVGKTRLDSVILPYETTMITPDSLIDSKHSKLIINGDMKVINSKPVLYTYNYDNYSYDAEIIPADIISTYMTQNPYLPNSILSWETLHNSKLHNIIVGVYGSWGEQDLLAKIKQLKAFKDKLADDSYIEEHESTQNGYLYVIASNPKIKTRVRTR